MTEEIYSCNYPVSYVVSQVKSEPISYSVKLNNDTGLSKTIFSGKLFPFDVSGETFEMDIAEICREYLDTSYEDLNFLKNHIEVLEPEWISSCGESTILEFFVESENNMSEPDEVGNIKDGSRVVMYNYNTGYISKYGLSGNLNEPIDDKVDPRQRLFICGYKYGDTALNFQYDITGYTVEKSPDGSDLNLNLKLSDKNGKTSKTYQMLALDLRKWDNFKGGEKIVLDQDGLEEAFNYEVVSPCKNKYVLYYVNKLGGMDSLLCSGKYIESWQSSNTDIRLYNNRGSSTSWEQKRIFTEIDKKYQLNTGLLKDEWAKRIDNLIYSPKVFLHNLDDNLITSCLITDTSCTLKQRKNNKLVQYTISLKESQKQYRR